MNKSDCLNEIEKRCKRLFPNDPNIVKCIKQNLSELIDEGIPVEDVKSLTDNEIIAVQKKVDFTMSSLFGEEINEKVKEIH